MDSYRNIYARGVNMLEDAGIADAKIDARLLLEYVCKTDRNYLLAHGDNTLEDDKISEYLEYIKLRANHVPLQHITGEQEFMGLVFKVNGHVLIPRQDTECLVEEAMIEISDGMSVLDMCTGSGCIIISLMKYKNDIDGVAVDISEDALEIARLNAGINEVTPEFLQGNLFEAFSEKRMFDVIVSNPPYIASDVVDTLMEEVKNHEPRLALDGDFDGLRFYRRIIDDMDEYLKPGGYVLFEIGYDQGEAVSELLKSAEYVDVKVVKDFAGLDRVVKGRKKCLIN